MEPGQARRARMERLERQYEAAPGVYRLRLALWAGLGYAVLASGLIVAAGLCITLIVLAASRSLEDWRIVFPILLLGMLAITLLRALWFRSSPPEGHRLGPGEAPALREEVERIRREVGAQRLHGIVIDDSLNAAAAYLPDGFGLRQRHYLVIGLPLLQLLDRHELASVIAHEFGHFHGGHGRFGGWIYRVRVSWRRLLDGFSAQGSTSQLFFWFFRWYAPRFEERSMVLVRRQEYVADAMAARVAGAVPAASALTRVHLASDWLARRFWPNLLRPAHISSHPPAQVHLQLARALADWRGRQEAVPAWVRREQPEPDDTHPALAQRLAALGVALDMALGRPGPAAAPAMLGEALLDRLEQRFSREWLAAARPGWEARHRAAQEAERRLQILADAATRTPDEWLEYATLLEEHRPGADPVPIYREGVRQRPSHAAGHGRLGILLLRQGHREAGLEHLERAMRLSPSLSPSLLREMDDHLPSMQEDERLHAAVRQLHHAFGQQADAPPSSDEDLQPHALEDEPLQAVRRVLAGHPRVVAAWLVRRKAPGLSVLPHYLLLLEWGGSVASERAAVPRLTGQLTLPGTFTVLTTTERTPLLPRLRAQAGEPFYRR